MRFLGFLFVIVMVLAVVGWFRGWYSIIPAQAGDKSEFVLRVDGDRIRSDGTAASASLGQLSAEAVEKVKVAGHAAGPAQSELEGTITAVDASAHDLTVTSKAHAIEMHVPATVSISKGGKGVGFAELRVGAIVKLVFQHIGDDRQLSGIDVLR